MAEADDTTNYTTIPGTNIRTQWVFVTPQMAKDYLERNTANRRKREKHVSRIATDMSENRFQITHQGLAFDDQDVMVDGQHRCQAIILANRGQWLLVTTGLPSASKNVVDHGAKRKAADFMPGSFKDLKSAAIRIILGIERLGGSFTANSLAASVQQITDSAIQENWDRWGDLDELAHLAHQASRNVAIGPSGLLAAAMVHEETAEEFLHGIHKMIGLEYGDPRLALLKYRNAGKRVQTPLSAFIAMKVAKAFDNKRTMNVLRTSQTEVLRVETNAQAQERDADSERDSSEGDQDST